MPPYLRSQNVDARGYMVLNILLDLFNGTLFSYWLSRVISKRIVIRGSKKLFYNVLCSGETEMERQPFGDGVLFIDKGNRQWHVAVHATHYIEPPQGYFTPTFNALHVLIPHELIMTISQDYRYYWMWVSICMFFPRCSQKLFEVRERCYMFCSFHVHYILEIPRESNFSKYGEKVPRCAVGTCVKRPHFSTVACWCGQPNSATNRIRDGHRHYASGCNCAYKGLSRRPHGIPQVYVYTETRLFETYRYLGVHIPTYSKTTIYVARSNLFMSWAMSFPPFESKAKLAAFLQHFQYPRNNLIRPRMPKPTQFINSVELFTFDMPIG